ncbi:MAG: type II secretion system protein [Victivallales bacterium]
MNYNFHITAASLPFRKHSEKTKWKRFTLLELLITIATIAILVAILLPSLHKVRGKGRQASCISAQKQYVTAYLQYTLDNDDFVCSVVDNNSNPETYWFYKLLPYTASSTNSKLHCPSVKNWSFWEGKFGIALYDSLLPAYRSEYIPVRTNMIRQASQLLILGDNDRGTEISTAYPGYCFSVWGKVDGNISSLTLSSKNHDGFINSTLFDGHIASYRKSDLYVTNWGVDTPQRKFWFPLQEYCWSGGVRRLMYKP